MAHNFTDKKTKKQKSPERVVVDAVAYEKAQKAFMEDIEQFCTDPRRSDWQERNAKILNGWVSFVKDHGYPPSNRQLSKLVGVSELSISRHLAETNPIQLFLSIQGETRMMMPNVTVGLYNKAIQGDVAAAKILIEAAFTGQMVNGLEDAIDRTNTVEIGEDEDRALIRGLSLFADAMEKEPVEAEIVTKTPKTTKKRSRKAKKTSKNATKREK